MGHGQEVVVGVDGSEGSAIALRWAADEAEARAWRLVPVLVWHLLDQRHVDGVERFDPDYDADRAMATLRHHVEEVLGERASAADLRVVCDRPAPGLLEAAAGAALLVVGARGLGGFRGLVLGSVSQHCVRHSPVPVAVVHETGVEAVRSRVVVGVDGSENGAAALRWAIDQAAATGARLDLVHAWHPPYVGGEPWASMPMSYDQLRAGAAQLLERVVRGVDLRSVEVAQLLVDGGAGSSLVEASAGAALVVVGARGRGGFAGLLLGSVGDQVVRHARCPVVVVPASDPS